VAQAAGVSPGNRYFLRADRLFDGRQAAGPGTVVVDGGRIEAVERGPMDPPAKGQVMDFGDATVLPGLIDSHVHLGFDGGMDPVGRMRADDDANLLLRMRLAAQKSLAAGVTTVRDLGDRSYLAVTLREWYRAGNEVGPEVLASGPPLTVTGGHCFFMGGEADGEAELRKAVRVRATRGVDVIKVMVTGGNMTAGIDPFTPQYTVAELAAVVEEGHRFGRTVTAHVHGVAGIERAVEAGVDGLEHCSFWVADGVRADQALIDRIAEQEIWVCPTAGIGPSPVPPPPAVAARLPGMFAAAARAHQAGVRLLAGTDAGIAPVKPHGIVAYSVQMLVDTVAMSTVDALKAATASSAEACGLAGRKGVLAPGADADLLVVRGDAVADVRRLHDVVAVFRAGVPVQDRAASTADSMADANRGMDRSTISSLAVSEMRK
jgi:imidazolonepropionase-like amidohydrolase